MTDSGSPLLDRDALLNALIDLVRRLRERHVPAGIRLVGGAAIALAYDHQRPETRDVDAYLYPSDDILKVAAEIAVERGWKDDWLNSKALAFQSHHDRDLDWQVIFEEGDVSVKVASPELLLAMKLLASRGSRDAPDTGTLLTACRITSLADAQAIFDRYYPDEEIKPSGIAVVKAWLAGDDLTSA